MASGYFEEMRESEIELKIENKLIVFKKIIFKKTI